MIIATNTCDVAQYSNVISKVLDSSVFAIYLVAEPCNKNCITFGDTNVNVFPWNGEDVDAVFIVANRPNSLWAFASTGAGMVYQTYIVTDQGVCPVLYNNVPESARLAVGILKRLLKNLEEGLILDPEKYLLPEVESLDQIYTQFRDTLRERVKEKLGGLKQFFSKGDEL